MIRLYAALALIIALVAGGWYYGHAKYAAGESDTLALVAKQDAAAAVIARQHEQDQRTAFDDAAKQYERDKTDAQAEYDRNIADLRSGQLRLRKRWTCPRVPNVAASAGQPDGDAALRQQDASDLVRLAAEADAQIRGLQAVLTGERK
jgi:hypothetical protein